MQETTNSDRANELRQLIDKVSAQPNRAWTEERKRIGVLQSQLAAHEGAKAH
ncbi:hypothetical protein [Croceicoccus mobilis]|uniref:Uncharacterized protein n=1 Tax=Croceicoccus mobilis TaxID=1703339 RepID=A0A916Z493_9SPHN|nr:hypothetical protein [Croceicoccus mobilis]GGD72919.1 hypothetical protein GCM10010990_23200 [Croceicoccus mobilis]